MSRTLYATSVMLLAVTTVQAAGWEVHGRVIDETGQSVAGAAVDSFWSGNGIRLHEDGTPLEPTQNKDDVHAFWKHVGEMEPFDAKDAAKTNAEGLFTLRVDDTCHTVLVMDAKRQHGGIGTLEKGREEQPIEIRLGPLVKVRGTFECTETGNPPFWSHVYVLVPDDPARPLDFPRLVSCGSFEGRFEVSLPPGRYVLDAYAESVEQEKNGIDVRVIPSPSLTLTADKPEVDLGTLRLVPSVSLGHRIEQAKANGTWGDYTQHYGQPPPRWNAVDARGVSTDVQISNYKGKWVLLDFWGMSCSICLREKLPNLMKFYEEHKAQRDQFEILSICIDEDGEMKTLFRPGPPVGADRDARLGRQNATVSSAARSHI
jgi:hypothetical protein